MPFPWGAAIGAAGSVIGSILDSNAAADQAKLQKQFAKRAIRWRVADARAAGIHPLAALGHVGPSYSPVQSTVGAGIAEGARQLGEGLSSDPATASAIEVNKAQAELLKAQTNKIALEMRASAQGATTGATDTAPPAAMANPMQMLRDSVQRGASRNPANPKVPDMFAEVQAGPYRRSVPNQDYQTDPETWAMGEILRGNARPAIEQLARDNGMSWPAALKWIRGQGKGFAQAAVALARDDVKSLGNSASQLMELAKRLARAKARKDGSDFDPSTTTP